jgi:CBS domain-containing membrane protein
MNQPSSPSVGEYMTEVPATIETGMSLADALDRMYTSNIRHLPVVNESGALVGALSTRDIAAASAVRGLDARTAKVESVMAPVPFSCSAETPLLIVIEEMERDRLGSAVITREGKPCGIFTTTDAMRVLRSLLSGEPVQPLVHPELEGHGETPPAERTRHGLKGASKHDGMVAWFLTRLG